MLTQSAGKATVRVIASPKNWMEGTAVQQLEKTAQLDGMRHAVGMPDLHPGKGSPIGAAFVTEGWIYPALVGSDIGCGIGLWRTELEAKPGKRDGWADRLRHLDGAWEGDAREYLAARGLEVSGHEDALGTIGSGNHFAELQAVEAIVNEEVCQRLGVAAGALYLCIHSGSRGLGEATLRGHIDEYGFAGLEAGDVPSWHYLARHDYARRWAEVNRELIAERFCERLRTHGERLVDLCHNSVEEYRQEGRVAWIHRKGAAPATHGPVLIPGSRGSRTYLVEPVESAADSGFSLAHGAGRKWSRSDSRAKLEGRYRARDLERTEMGNPVICEDKQLLYEEAPQAYKNIAIVIEDLVAAGLARVVAVFQPMVTYKVRR